MHSTQNANDQNQSVVVSPQRQNSPASAAVSMRRHSGPGRAPSESGATWMKRDEDDCNSSSDNNLANVVDELFEDESKDCFSIDTLMANDESTSTTSGTERDVNSAINQCEDRRKNVSSPADESIDTLAANISISEDEGVDEGSNMEENEEAGQVDEAHRC